MTASRATRLTMEQWPPSPATQQLVSTRQSWPRPQVSLLLATLVMPWVFSFGSLAISPYRLVLLALAPFCLAQWVTGKAGRIRMVDILLLLFCLWSTIALGAVHGAGQAFESGGMLFIETFGGYLVARCYVRTVEDFRAAAKFLLLLVALLLPLAVAEAVTGQRLTLQLFRTLAPTIVDGMSEPRWGLTRVQGPFEHPILFGVFCGAPLGVVFLVFGQELSFVTRWAMAALIVLTAMLSLSSGPIVAVLMQLALLVWNGLLRGVAARWLILWVLAILAYAILELASDQTMPQILTRFAFDPWTAFYRLLIFDYGWQSVMSHPVFGTGFDDWLHPAWMTSSIDMFWLVPAIRYGLPAGVLCLAAFLAAYVGVGLKGGLDTATQNCRVAYVITLTGFFTVGWAVHFWNATYVLFVFMLGSGIWILDAPKAETGVAAARKLERRVAERVRPAPPVRSSRRPIRRHAQER